MTIKELYQWAVENEVENAFLGVSISDVQQTENGEYIYFDYAEPIQEPDLEIGKLFDPTQTNIPCLGPCVWINRHED